jgi:hypothetical protein
MIDPGNPLDAAVTAVNALPGRRGFLKAAVALLTGTTAPANSRFGVIEGIPNFESAPDAEATANHRQELLVRVPDLDGIRLRTAHDDEISSQRGVVLDLYRYEPPDGMSRTVHRLVRPWMDVRAGLYVRSAVPYRLRIRLDPDDGELATSVVLGRRASVAVFRETPRGIEQRSTPWQVLVVVT